MDTLPQASIDAWRTGRVGLHDILTAYRITHADLGRMMGAPMPDLIISFRHCGERWPHRDWPALDQARLSYDAGLIEMFQGRVGDFFIQYAVPRKKPVKSRRYFTAYGQES